MDNMDIHDMFGLSDGWSASPDDLIDSFLTINGDFFKELDDSQNMQFNAISEANSTAAAVASQHHVPGIAAVTDTMPDDFHGFLDSGAHNQLDLSEYINFGDEPVMSSSSSDSGLSSDNMEMDMSPDYEPLSPAMSSPGPSISERGGTNSPARSLVSEPGIRTMAPAAIAAPAVVAPSAPAAAPPAQMPIFQPMVQKPQQQQPQQKQQPQQILQQQPMVKAHAPQAHTPQQTKQHQQQPLPTVAAAVPMPIAVANKAKTFVINSPTITTTNTKPRYVIEKTAGGSTIIVSDVNVAASKPAVAAAAPVASAPMAQKRPAPVQPMQHTPIKKEVKIYKMSPSVGQTMSSSTTTTTTATMMPTGGAQPKKVTIQMKDGKPIGSHPAGTYVINRPAGVGNFAGVRKLVRVQQGGIGGTNGGAARSILLPVSFQDVKDFRTIKIINASNLGNKSANIKLAAANLLQQSKQGLVQKNVLFSKEQLIDDSLSDPSTSDAESYVFEDVLMQASSSGTSSKSSSVVSSSPVGPSKQMHSAPIIHRNVIINRSSIATHSNSNNNNIVNGNINSGSAGSSNHHSDADDSADDDDGDDDGSDYMNGQSTGMSANGTYPKLLLTNEEKRLLDKEGIALPGNYPLTKHEERELKRIRRKIRNKISAQDSRKRKKEYVDGLEERVKQCTDENQTLIKRLKLLQSQHTNLSHQVKKLQAMLSKTGVGGGLAGAVSGAGGKMTQPATCLMVLLLSLALVAAPNLKLGQNDKDAEIAEMALQQQEQESLLPQNRRSLLFDTNEQMGDALVDEEIAMDDVNEHDYAGCSTAAPGALSSSALPMLLSSKPKTFVDFDLDDAPWKPPCASPAAGDVKHSPSSSSSLFAERAAGFQETLRAATPRIADFEHSVNGAKMAGLAAGGMYEVKLEPMDTMMFGGASGAGGELAADAKKRNESKVADGGRQTILMKGA